MGAKDIKIVVLSFVGVLILILFAAFAPIYRMPDGSYERYWVWNAPRMPVGNGYDKLTSEDIERLNADPAQRQILEGMKNAPRSIPIRPIYLGSKHGPDRNVLGYTAMLAVIGWLVLVGHKWANR